MDESKRKRRLQQDHQPPQEASCSTSKRCPNSPQKTRLKMRGSASWSVIRLVRRGKTELVKAIIEKLGFSYAKQWAGGYNLLCIALQTKNLVMTKMLIEMGCRVNCNSRRRLKTPLHSAVRYGFEDIVLALLENDASVIARDGTNATPLHYAVIRRNYKIVRMLLNHGAELDAKTNRLNTPLHLAVKGYGRTKIAELLLERGAEVDVQDESGRTILYIAAKHGPLDIVRLILCRLPDLADEQNRRSLHAAVRSLMYSREVVNALLDYGFRFTAKDAQNSVLLHAAARQGNVRVIESLLKLGANVNAINKSAGGVTLLHSSIYYRYYELTELLLEYGADPNVADCQNDAPIRYALEQKHAMLAILLLSSKNIQISPELFLYAVKTSTHENVKAVLSYGRHLPIEARDSVGRTALHLTSLNTAWYRSYRNNFGVPISRIRLKSGKTVPVKVEAPETVPEMLLDHGVPIEARDQFGRTALHLAAQLRNHEVIRVLLDHGADPNVRCANDMIPLDYTTIPTPEYNEDDDHSVYPLDEIPVDNSLIWVHDYSRPGTDGISARMLMLPAELAESVNSSEQRRDSEADDAMEARLTRWHNEVVRRVTSTRLGDSRVSPYDFLTKSVSQLAHCTRNPEVAKYFEQNKSDIEPFYYCLVINRYKLAVKRETLLGKGLESFKLLTGDVLPELAALKVLHYLYNQDLKNLIRAGRDNEDNEDNEDNGD